MFKWFDPDKADQYPKRKVFIQPTTLGDAIEMRAAKDGDAADQCFDPETELGNLWLTLQQCGLNVRSVHLQLFGADGEKITPDVEHPDNDYGYAYTEAQLKAMPVPKNLFMLRHKFGAPSLSVSAVAYTPKAKPAAKSRKVQRAAITRVTAPGDKAGKPTLKRGQA